MIVHCDKCNTPYQCSENQITDQGLVLRCSNCQQAFRVVAKTFYLVETFDEKAAGNLVTPSLAQPAPPEEVAKAKAAETPSPIKSLNNGRMFESERATSDMPRKFGQIAPASSLPLEMMSDFNGRSGRKYKKKSKALPLFLILVLLVVGAVYWQREHPQDFENIMRHLERKTQNLSQMIDPQAKVNDDARSVYMKGRGAFSLDSKAHYLEAIDFFHQSLAIDPDYAVALASLAEADLEVAEIYLEEGEVSRSREYLDEAIRSSTKATTLDPKSLEATRAMAAYERIQGNFVKSQDLLNQLLGANPNDAEILVLMGRNYLTKTGLEDVSEKYLVKAISLNDLSIRAHRYLAVTYERKQERDEALKEWQKVRDLNAQHELAAKSIERLESENQKTKTTAVKSAKVPASAVDEKKAATRRKPRASDSGQPEEPQEQ